MASLSQVDVQQSDGMAKIRTLYLVTKAMASCMSWRVPTIEPLVVMVVIAVMAMVVMTVMTVVVIVVIVTVLMIMLAVIRQ